ncbi:MAG: DNA repair protein RadA [Planctomycetes bacterium]|nr:DNA repair protein RadA [Planctomycetota bacterium]
MAKKNKSVFICSACDLKVSRWAGRCPGCGESNTLAEGDSSSPEGRAPDIEVPEPRPASDYINAACERILLGEPEIDRTLGGGIVRGASMLICGIPGVGKSTLALSWAGKLAARGEAVIYLCGEEAPAMVAERARRMGCLHENLKLAETMEVRNIGALIERQKPTLLVIDSLQTLRGGEEAEETRFGAGRGSMTEALSFLADTCKQNASSLLAVGHLTKEGLIAGPRTIEHLVDCVLLFEPQGELDVRILRCTKNRFAACDEIGVFRMGSKGLVPVQDCGALFWESRGRPPVPGSALCPVMEGGRVFLVEFQALVASSQFATPTRKVSGYDPVRVAMIIAVLERRFGLQCGDMDIFVSVTGGFRVRDPGGDLAMTAAIASSARNLPLDGATAFFGEVGLAGEIRPCRGSELRIRECNRLGLRSAGNLAGKARTGFTCIEGVGDLMNAL